MNYVMNVCDRCKRECRKDNTAITFKTVSLWLEPKFDDLSYTRYSPGYTAESKWTALWCKDCCVEIGLIQLNPLAKKNEDVGFMEKVVRSLGIGAGQ